jgi:deoxyribonuclease (pyrimidine dimer)
MTRINLVHVQDLADQHLFAEWREIKMVPAALRRSLKTRSIKDILTGVPKKYTLNTGHVYFFFDKMTWLANRYTELTYELINRDYNITEHSTLDIFFKDIPVEFTLDTWQSTIPAVAINVERINLRISERPDWYKHYGDVKSPEYFAALYKLQIDTVAA